MRVQYVAEMDLDLGEKVHVRSEVKPKCGVDIPFAIRSAVWELIKIKDGSMEASGDCVVTEHEIDALIEPKEACSYILKYIYKIADETWVDNVKIEVG